MPNSVEKLDVHYFKKNLEKILSEIDCYTPDELSRACTRLATTADESVLLEDGGVAQKAFWHALEFCNDPDNRNIRQHWVNYKELLRGSHEPS